MSQVIEVSFVPNEGGRSQAVSVSTTSAQSSVLYTNQAGYVNILSTVDCFIRMGTNPTALATGVDQFIPANNLFRTGPIPAEYKIAAVTGSGTGTVYITKES